MCFFSAKKGQFQDFIWQILRRVFRLEDLHKTRALLKNCSGQNKSVNLAGTSGNEGFGARAQGRPRGHHIIDENNALVFHLWTQVFWHLEGRRSLAKQIINLVTEGRKG